MGNKISKRKATEAEAVGADKFANVKLPTLTAEDKITDRNITVLFVLGGPGAGKGTQSKLVAKDYGFVHLSAGDLLRAEMQRQGSELGELIQWYIKEGQIVPFGVTISLLKRAISESKADRFLIDGFPRKIDQAEAFENFVCESKAVLFFDAPEDTLQARLLQRAKTSGRTDDNLESIRKRFVTYREQTYPVIELYDKENKVVRIPSTGTVDEVYAATKAVVEKLIE